MSAFLSLFLEYNCVCLHMLVEICLIWLPMVTNCVKYDVSVKKYSYVLILMLAELFLDCRLRRAHTGWRVFLVYVSHFTQLATYIYIPTSVSPISLNLFGCSIILIAITLYFVFFVLCYYTFVTNISGLFIFFMALFLLIIGRLSIGFIKIYNFCLKYKI